MSGKTRHRRVLILTGLATASLAVAPSAILSSSRPASAGTLVVAHERAVVLDALQTSNLLAVRAADPTGEEARYAVDDRDDTAWQGRAGETQWKWAASFERPVHLGLLRARLGRTPTSGVPTDFHWEARFVGDDWRCDALSAASDDGWAPIGSTDQRTIDSDEFLAQPTRRSWFVDVMTCGLRLVVD